MTLKKQYYAIAAIMIALALLLGGFTIVHAEGEDTTETVEVTTTDEEENSTDLDETKQKLEEISTKVDKVDNQIASQKVDSQKIEDQANEIEAIKEELVTIKSTLPSVPTGGNQTINMPYDVNKIIPLRKSKPVYVYRLTIGPTSSGTTNRVYIFASNSPDLSLGQAASNSGQTLYYIAIKNIYTENDGELKQPVCGCQINTSTSNITESEAISLVTNSSNWGFTTLTEAPAIPSGNATVQWGYQVCQNKSGGYMVDSAVMLVPYGEQHIAPEQEGPEYFTAIGQYRPSDGLFARITAPGASSNLAVEPTLEIIQTIEPTVQEWTTEQLYMPILVIMAVLVIILFKKK